jgi:hypothetical protein
MKHEIINNARYCTKNASENYGALKHQIMYFYDMDYITVHDIKEVKEMYIEYIANNETDNNFCFNDYIEMITSKNSNIEPLYLNDITEYDFIKRNIEYIKDIDMLITMINVMIDGQYNNI